MQLNCPHTTWATTCSNVDAGVTATGDVETESRVTTATPPWFVDRSLPTRGRGRSTTLQPPVRKRPIHSLSASCHVSVRQRISTRRSRMHSITSSVLLCSDRTFRQANVTSSAGEFETETTRAFCFPRTRRPARHLRRRAARRPVDAPCAQRPKDSSRARGSDGQGGGEPS